MARDVRVNILGDSRDFSRAMASARGDADRLDGSLSRTSGGISSFARNAALGFAGVAVAAGAMGLSFLRAAEESQRVTGQTNAVLESMGATAWTTAGQVAALSTELSNQTGIDDELIQSGQNVLLTFAQVQNRVGEGNDIFDRATEAALNMSVALGTDMTAASMAIGRALNDPIRGLTTLRRSGIQFTAQQEEQIRTMVEAGDVAGAQTVMLAELERQFGGSAEAQATASQRLSTIWGNLQEQLGEYLIPLAEDFADWMAENLPDAIEKTKEVVSDLVERGQDMVAWLKENKEIVVAVAAAIGTVLVAAFVAWAVSATAAAVATLAAVAPVLLVGAAIALLVAGIIYAYQEWDWFRETVDKVWTFLKDSLWPNIQDGARIVKDILVAAINDAKDAFQFLKDKAVEIWPLIQGAFNTAKGPILAVIDAITAAIRFAIDTWKQLHDLLSSSTAGKDLQGIGGGQRAGTGAGMGLKSYHSGGIYTAPGGAREGLAWLETGERITPRGQSADGGGGMTTLVFQVGLHEFARLVVDSQVLYNRTDGPIPVTVAG